MSMRNRMHRLPFFVAAALAGCSPANDGADAAAPDASALVDGGCLAMSVAQRRLIREETT